MILKPSFEDIKVILHNIGRLIIGIGILMSIPLITSILFAEWSVSLDFGIGGLLSLGLGILLFSLFKSEKEISWIHGLVVASMSWIAAMFLGAIPLYLSGHFGSYLDACFDAMSGFATTGLVLIQDVNHASNGLNMWRHFMMFLGGQGIIVVGLTFLIRGTGGAYKMYVGEAREERILPNVIQTARFIWKISLVYLIIGTASLAVIGLIEGMAPLRALLHGIWIFMAAFDTGGFTPQSQSILYYHSFPFEIVTIGLMLLGTLNFGLHYALWKRDWKEPFRNIETITLFFSVMFIFTLTAIGLKQFVTYSGMAMFRKGFYQIISGHSGTGYMTIGARQFINEWGPMAMVGATLAMAAGGSACSTAGGIKVLRIGIFFKALFQDVKKILSPGTALITEKFHHLKDIVLEEKFVRSALLIILTYILTYTLGTVVGMFYGFPLYQAVFESVSAAANVGLSCGITSPTMPTPLKITYIIEMWLGRLEFMSIFALIGFIIAYFRGK